MVLSSFLVKCFFAGVFRLALSSPPETIIRQKNEKSKGKILKKSVSDFIFYIFTLSNSVFYRVCLIKIFLIFFGKFFGKKS